MTKYHAITTDAGIEFETGIKSIDLIETEIVTGRATGFVKIFKKGELHAKVHQDKIDTIYFTK